MSTRKKIPERASAHLVRWYGEHLPRDVVVLRGSWIGRLFGAFGQSAVTINGTVHLTARAPDLETDAGIAFLGHEIYHVLQQVQMGWWRYFVLYSLRPDQSGPHSGGLAPPHGAPRLRPRPRDTGCPGLNRESPLLPIARSLPLSSPKMTCVSALGP